MLPNLEMPKEKVDTDTVLRDDHGRPISAGAVRLISQSPTSSEPVDDDKLPPLPSEGLRRAVTEPLLPEEQNGSEQSPQTAGRYVTDTQKKRPTRRSSASPLQITRSGTNISQLQEALWTAADREPDSSGTESSTDDDDDLDADISRTDEASRAPSQQKNSTSKRFRKFRVGNKNYKTKGKVSEEDGRLSISVKDLSHTGYLTKALGTATSNLGLIEEGDPADAGQADQELPTIATSDTVFSPETFRCPPLNIVIMIIGSRGDAQPFLKIGKVLKEQYGHRVRIATHPAFRDFVEKDSGLEFFSAGGNPSELMAFMVKNPGMIPTLETVRSGDIGRRREAMAEMFDGFWRACVNATDGVEDAPNSKMEKRPFIADLIIANPASFAHVHCAEALGIPLILSFTFPYTPTKAFPHPLAVIKKTNLDPGHTNFMSYPLVEMMIWQGLGDLINDLRVRKLGLDPVSTLWAPGAAYRMKVPYAYLWSPSLVPKPADWGEEIDICGFVFLDLASSFTPPDPLSKFLDAGEMPVYIGFGSIVVDDADKFTQMIFEAVKLAGVRALVSKGWGGLGGDSLEVPENIFMLDNIPHDWLFPKVKACVIHGGAGTTAIALKCGRPLMIVPFFGDQFFWGNMVEEAKAGPKPVPYRELSAEKLAAGIKYCLTEEAQMNAQDLARNIEKDGNGAENMCAFVHQHLTLSGRHSLRCSILDDRVAVWWMKGTGLRLSAMAANVLVEKGLIQWRGLRLIRHREWNDFEGPGEPVTGVLGSVAGTLRTIVADVAGGPKRVAKLLKRDRERKERQRLKLEKAKLAAQSENSENGIATIASSPSKQQTAQANGNRTGESKEPKEPKYITLTPATTRASAQRPWYINEVSHALHSAGAFVSAPIDLSVALAQGFHNAPRLYGDDTVRRPPRVTGIQSGLRAARKEFVYGIYDAWTGVVRLPMRGAEQGVRGFTKGVGMGLTGFVLKDIAAIVGPVGYTLKGVKKQVERRRQPYRHVRRARILQGQQEMAALSDDERKTRTETVETVWTALQLLWELEKKEMDQGGAWAHFTACYKLAEGDESLPSRPHAAVGNGKA